MADNPVWKAAKPFVNGGLSGMAATCIIQPIDMVKVRLQLGATGGPVSARLGPAAASMSRNCQTLAARQAHAC
jgi:solute carrier family 25 oxoglutarate transporter 11